MNIINRRNYDLAEGEAILYQEYKFIPKVPDAIENWEHKRLYSVTLRNRTSGELERIRYRLLDGIHFYSRKGFHYIWGKTTGKGCYIFFKYDLGCPTDKIDTIALVRCSEFEKLNPADRIGLFGRITAPTIT